MPAKDETLPATEWKLQPDTELRLVVDQNEKASITLVSGKAEIFGSEITMDQPVVLSNTRVAVYAIQDTTLVVRGKAEGYVGTETKTVPYQNVAYLIHQQRIKALQEKKVGPKVLITGSRNSGKTTLTKILCNYSLKLGWLPLLVDIDISDYLLSPPGTISASLVDMPLPNDYMSDKSISYFCGESSTVSTDFYLKLVRELATAVNSKLVLDLDKFKKQYSLDDPAIPAEWKQAVSPSEPRLYASGAIISAMSADSKGSDTIEKIMAAFEVDIVLVLDYEKLHNDLYAKYASRVQIVKLEKSGGVSDISSTPEMKQKQIKAGLVSYFRGATGNMKSYQTSIPMAKYKLFRIFKETLPLTALPYGTTEEYQNIRPELVNLQKEEDIQDRIVGCLYVDLKIMRELEEKIATGSREAELKYSKIIMAAPCSSIMQMLVDFPKQNHVERDITEKHIHWKLYQYIRTNMRYLLLTFYLEILKAIPNSNPNYY